VSFGLLTKLASHPLKPDEIAGFYRAEAMIARRFEQLEGSDLIIQTLPMTCEHMRTCDHDIDFVRAAATERRISARRSSSEFSPVGNPVETAATRMLVPSRARRAVATKR